MNKYLEKIAGFTPRYVTRAIKEGLPNVMKDLKGTGSRAARAETAKGISENIRYDRDYADRAIKARKSLVKSIYGTNGGNHRLMNDTILGNLETSRFKANSKLTGAERRVKRTALANSLARKSARGVVLRTSAGAGISSSALAGAAVTSKKDK